MGENQFACNGSYLRSERSMLKVIYNLIKVHSNVSQAILKPMIIIVITHSYSRSYKELPNSHNSLSVRE